MSDKYSPRCGTDCCKEGPGDVETECSGCCPGGVFPAELTVRIPGLSGTNIGCDSCGSIPTEYVLTYDTDTAFTCRWRYIDEHFCDGTAVCPGKVYTLTVSLAIFKVSCLVAVEWHLETPPVVGTCQFSGSSAAWETAEGAAEDVCNGGTLELDIYSEGIDDSNDACDMTYPTTIEVDF